MVCRYGINSMQVFICKRYLQTWLLDHHNGFSNCNLHRGVSRVTLQIKQFLWTRIVVRPHIIATKKKTIMWIPKLDRPYIYYEELKSSVLSWEYNMIDIVFKWGVSSHHIFMPRILNSIFFNWFLRFVFSRCLFVHFSFIVIVFFKCFSPFYILWKLGME